MGTMGRKRRASRKGPRHMLSRIGKADEDYGLARVQCCYKRHDSAGLPRSTGFSLPALRHRLQGTVRSSRLFVAESAVVTDGPRHGGSGREGRGPYGSQRPRSGLACLSRFVGSGQVTYQNLVTSRLCHKVEEPRPRQLPGVSA